MVSVFMVLLSDLSVTTKRCVARIFLFRFRKPTLPSISRCWPAYACVNTYRESFHVIARSEIQLRAFRSYGAAIEMLDMRMARSDRL